MPRLQWGTPRSRTYEKGVDRGVLFPPSGPAVVWPGLVQIEELQENIEIQEDFFEGRKYQTHASRPDFSARLTAYASPLEFYPCDGYVAMAEGLYATRQVRQRFGLSYRTLIGNDVEGLDHGYKIHFIYNAMAVPSNIAYATKTEDIDPLLLRWTLRSIPYNKREYVWFMDPDEDGFADEVPTLFAPVSHVTVSSLSVLPENLSLLEDVIYGTETTAPEMPTPVEILEIIR